METSSSQLKELKMTPDGQDSFVASLKALQEKYPEYRSVLKLLIEQIQSGRASGVQAKLQQLQSEDW
jgi:hypothetical protein